MTLTPSKFQKNATIVANVSYLPAFKWTKNTYRPQMRINSDQNTQFWLLSVVGWVWQHQKFIKRQEQANLSLLMGKSQPQIATFANRKSKIANFAEGSDEKSPGNCGMKSRIAAFRNCKLQIAVSFKICFRSSRSQSSHSRFPKFSIEIQD